MKLRLRLSLSFAIVIAVGSATSFLLVRSSTESLFRSFVFSGDAEKAKVYGGLLGEYYSRKGSWEGVQPYLSTVPVAYVRAAGALLEDRIAVADSAGLIVADTSGKLLGTAHPPMHLAQGVAIQSGGSRVGTVLVGSMIDSTFTGANERFVSSIASSLAWSIAASVAIALLLGFALSSRITRPLASLGDAARRVAEGDLGAIVRVEGEDEVSELSSSFNAMTDELRRLEEAKRRIIADSAHELRTPVTLIRGSIEAMIDGIYPADEDHLRSVHEETLRLSRLIDALRELELIDSGGLRLEREDLDLLEAARKAALLFGPQAGEKGIEIEVRAEQGDAPRAFADALRLDEILYNLTSNAVKYAPEGGRIRLSALAEGEEAILRVEDSGSGIPIEERELIFERFYRMDGSRAKDRGGRGLGLAIAREIALAHGGSLSAEGSSLGGAAFILRLPAI
jgi:two-component system OmpR family sensor kinase/two-component system sensor histidine kinase BaeS